MVDSYFLCPPAQLVQVPDIEIRLEMKKPHDLMDHVQVCVATFLFFSWHYLGLLLACGWPDVGLMWTDVGLMLKLAR